MGALIRVLVADDHEVVRRGLRLFLDLQEGITVVDEAADGAAAVELARSARPDVILMDLVMPELDGIEATRLATEVRPEAKVLVLSSFSDEERVLAALRAGAAGYLTKDASPEQLAAAIRALHRGEPVFCPDVLRRLTEHVVAERRRPEGTVTILFTDVEESTPIVERLGDDAARELFREHDDVVRRVVGNFDGIEIDHLGDGFMVAFSSARRAVGCALAVQEGLESLPLKVRAGLNTGDVIAEQDGYFGRTVFVASRVVGQAAGGEVLVTEVTRQLVGDAPGAVFVERGLHELKGLSGTHRLYQALPRS
jgi:DNA-binding NarL/FixJ family response regulator